MDYCYCKPLGLIVTTAGHSVTTEDLMAFHRRLLHDPEIPPGMREIVDLRNVVDASVDVESVGAIASIEASLSARIGSAQIAVVATLPVAFGMGRMYEMLSAGTPVRVSVFSELTPALSWLGVSADEIRRHMPGFEA